MTLPFHPYADLFPLIEGEEFLSLVADLKTNGLLERIVILDGMILDGRNRYRAAIAAGLIREDDGPDHGKHFVDLLAAGGGEVDPLAFVFSKNIHRRHLSISQRAYAMAEYETLRHGGARKPAEQDAMLRLEPIAPEPKTRANLAQIGQVSERSITTAAVVRDHAIDDVKMAVKSGAVTVSTAEKIARLPEQEQPAELAKVLPSGNRTIMASRQEPGDSLDYFPTPPWATRALMEHVLPQLGIHDIGQVWEPACGEGHMSAVLEEYASTIATDIFDYSSDLRMPPSWWRTLDFLCETETTPAVDWIITNPPFAPAEDFALRALKLASAGVAFFVRWQWIESVGRYQRLFNPYPPTLVCPFAERVPICKGQWDPDGSTATAYCWIVWHKPLSSARLSTRLFWIPPGQREALTRPDDAERFTAHPVVKKLRAPSVDPPQQDSAMTDDRTQDRSPLVIQTNRDDGLTIPDFLKRTLGERV